MVRYLQITGMIILILSFGMFSLSAFGQQEEPSESLKAVTTIFPLFDFTRTIGGEHIEVSLILPPGVEAHSYEPAPRDIVQINQADLFIYAGKEMEPWANRVIQSLTSPDIHIVDASKPIDLLEAPEDHHHSHNGDNHNDHHDSADPHFWTDPVLVKDVVDAIAQSLIETDPENASYYEAQAQAYNRELDALHEDIQKAVESFEATTILYGGHFAFGYFANRYGLDHISPYSGFSPSSEPTSRRIAELIRKMEELDLDVIYHEELIEPRIARIISEETGAQMKLLHGLHNVTKQEKEEGATYISIMRENLEKLKEGLGK